VNFSEENSPPKLSDSTDRNFPSGHSFGQDASHPSEATSSSRSPGFEESLSNQQGSPGPASSLGISGLLCWLLILGITGFILLTNVLEDFVNSEQSEFLADPSSTELTQAAFQGKGVVAQHSLNQWLKESSQPKEAEPDIEHPQAEQEAEVVDQIDQANQDQAVSASALPKELDRGTLIQRWCYTILLNEMEGAAAALDHFRKIEDRVAQHPKKMTEKQQKIGQAIESLLMEYAAGDFESTRNDQQVSSLLKKELGWFGELLLVPAGCNDPDARQAVLSSANVMFWSFGAIMMLGLLATFLGVILLIVIIALTSTGKISMQLQSSSTPAVVYLQTFSIWLLLFLGLQLSLGMILDVIQFPSGVGRLIVSGLGFFGSLAALIWPLTRGVSAAQLLRDLGLDWTLKTVLRDGVVAGFAYIAVLPGLLVAVIFIAVASASQTPDEFSGSKGPAHPVQPLVSEGDASVFLGVLFVACIAAPIVEEIMFRGVLYRHLRSYSQFWSRLSSILFACLINSFIFAAIHPQGLLGIPLLMTLAIGFSLAREYQDSLFASIVMHGINNFMALTVTFFIFR